MKFNRILFKISGEGLAGDNGFGYDNKSLEEISRKIKLIHELGTELCLVVGGGNIFRGAQNTKMDRNNADYMGMLATIMNGIALSTYLSDIGVKSEIQSALTIDKLCDCYNRNKALKALKDGKVLLFVGGTGNPFFTTDTASVLRAVEMQCDAIFKGTQVDGVYNKDPKKFPDAKRYKTVTFDEVIKNNLKIMDQTAFTLAKDNNLPIVVLKLSELNSVKEIIEGKNNYTLISNNVDVSYFE